MKKPIYIFFALFCFSCEVTEIKDSKYEYMYGKWKSESHDELWIDHNYVFFGCPDFPLICNYFIKNDSIYCYLKTRDKILRKNALPKLSNSDTIIFGQHIDENFKSILTKYYRVRKNLPVIDTTKNWEKQALLEIVNYSYDKK